MRFKYLDLMSFGCFTNYRADFDPASSFHIIYGLNETGKSTLLRAITDVLYGIPETTRDAYLHSTRNLRIGAGLIHSDGRELVFVRRKGRVNTLLDPEGVPLDEDVLAPFLGGVDRNTFKLMFGLNYKALTEGGKTLLQSGGNVGVNLFEAASGISGLRDLINEFHKEAKELFSRKKPINGMIARYNEQLRKVREFSLATRGWIELEKNYEKEKNAVNNLIKEIKQLERNKARLERVKRTLPLLSQRKEHQAKLEQLREVKVLPETARSERFELQRRLNDAEKTSKKLEERLKQLEQDKQKLKISPELLAQNPFILELYESLGQYRQNIKDVHQIQGEIVAIEQSINSLMRDVYPQFSSLKEVEQLRPPLERLEKVRELADKHLILMEKLQNVKNDIKKVERAIKENKEKKEQIGSLKDVKHLRAAIQRAQKKGNLEEVLQETRRNAQETKRQLTAELKKIIPWSSTLAKLESLPVPMAATVESFAGRIEEIHNDIKQTGHNIEQLQEEIHGLEERLSQLEFQEDVPSQEVLNEVREYRDKGWRLVRRAWLEGNRDTQAEREFNPEKPLPDAYEEAVVKADNIVDKMRYASEQVVNKANLLGSLKTRRQKLNTLVQEKSELDNKQKLIENEWKELWQPCGIDPLSPKEMLSWLNNYERIIEQARNLDNMKNEAAGLEQEIERYRDEIGNALAGLGEQVNKNERLEDLISRGQEICSFTDKLSGTMERLEEEAIALQQQLKDIEKEKDDMDKSLIAWKCEWKKAMCEMAFPPDTTPGVAKKLIESITRLFGEIDELKKKAIIKKQKLDDIKNFEIRAKHTIEKVPDNFSNLKPDQAIVELKQKCDVNNEYKIRLDAINKQIQELEKEQREAQQEITLSKQALDTLMEKAGCRNITELEKAEELSETVRESKKKIIELNERLLETGDGLSLEQIASEAEGINPDTLPGEIEDIKRRLEKLDQERSNLLQQFGALKKEYEEKIHGNSIAATEAAEEAESIMASLEQEVAKYVRLRLAAAILRTGIERYREQNQSPVVKRAGDLFSQLTLGSFAGLTVDYDEKDNPILLGVRNPPGETVRIEGMSDGTQDQLYLSLRLASIEKYLKEIEPIPLVVDDILVNFDDERARETLRVLASFSEHTQVIFFTHHKALLTLAKETVPENIMSVHYLMRGNA